MLQCLARYVRCRVSRLAGFAAARSGATAVEFALIAPAFIAVVLAVLQTAIFLFAQAALQNAAMQGGRLFMTGQAQNGAMTQSQFVNAICPALQPLFDCNSLIVDVESYSSFSGADASTPILTYNAQGQVTNNWSYTPGSPGQVMVVRLIYQWSVANGPLGLLLSNLPNNAAEMMGVAAFRVEPY